MSAGPDEFERTSRIHPDLTPGDLAEWAVEYSVSPTETLRIWRDAHALVLADVHPLAVDLDQVTAIAVRIATELDWWYDENYVLDEKLPGSNEAARLALSALVTAWPGSLSAFARDVLGRDRDNVSDWLGGRDMPRQLSDWVQRVVSVTVASNGTVLVKIRPRAVGQRGRPKKTVTLASTPMLAALYDSLNRDSL